VMRARKLYPYFLHNLDGRRCAIVWAHSIRDVARALRTNPSEVRRLEADKEQDWALAGIEAAKAHPGRLFTQPITTYSKSWVAQDWGRVPVSCAS
jgi:hypothetical protein